MNNKVIKERTQTLALRVVNLCEFLFETKRETSKIITRQLLRSGTSVGANYRAACRAKSKADFINKLKIVEEEADETLYWLEILEEAELVESSRIEDLKKEGSEILAMVVSSIISLKGKHSK